ncbi:MAG: hypothetical protein CBB87_00225 [Micavibrio sp. TMED27]|nr:N-acetylneuraminate synthase [Micavibrio sp.]OUT93020.1 MAG: hypothetical protein CBB87_00225 [Micavibrio sp. TMED27]|tara:strand:- start:17877 stop:18896 length:1020 start_codon:yes stop_codon:yes gene_type:complete
MFDEKCFIIAEVAQAHDASFMLAKSHINVAADAGCDAVKFQIHLPKYESTPDEKFRVPIDGYKTRSEYWERTCFEPEQWKELADYAASKGLVFMASAFSLQAIDMLEEIGVPVWKISSGETSNVPMLHKVGKTGLPVIISTGMSPMKEIEDAVNILKSYDIDVAITQCTTQYPTPPSQVGLNVMNEYKERFGTYVGLSDHSGTIYPAIAAAWEGASVIEVHICMSYQMPGPDMPASLDPEDLKRMVEGVRFAEEMRANPLDKDEKAKEFVDFRKLFFQSIYVKKDIKAGETFSEENLEIRKPCNGIPASQWDDVVGLKAANDIESQTFLKEEHIRKDVS